MKREMMKRLMMLGMVVLMALFMVACGEGDDTPEAEAPVDTEEQAEGEDLNDDVEEEGVEEVAPASTDELLASVADEDSYLILDGVAAGWAPTIMVLLNDGTFYGLVDYAGEATVKFVEGGYEETDGVITTKGTQYNTGEEIEYEIISSDGVYTTTIAIPDAGADVELTGTLE